MSRKQIRSNRALGAVSYDPDLFRSGSILIYCRASLTLSLLVFASIAAMVYSDFYDHLLRPRAASAVSIGPWPEFLFTLLAVTAGYLSFRPKPRLERAALLILAGSFLVMALRGMFGSEDPIHLGLCVVSLMLDLSLLAVVISFYRRYPNLLKKIRRKGLSPGE